MEREEITILSLASSKSKSLRTTFPISIAKLLRLKEGDRIKWEIEARDNELLILVKPLKKERYEKKLDQIG